MVELTTAEYDALRAEKTRADTLYELLYYAIARYGFVNSGGVVAALQVFPITIPPNHTVETLPSNYGTLTLAIRDISPAQTDNPEPGKELADSPENETLTDLEYEALQEVAGENGEGEGATTNSVPSPTLDSRVTDFDGINCHCCSLSTLECFCPGHKGKCKSQWINVEGEVPSPDPDCGVDDHDPGCIALGPTQCTCGKSMEEVTE